MEVSRRVIFNDRRFLLNTLRAPLEYSHEHGGWYYTDPTYVLPAAIITEGELLAFFLSVELARRQLGTTLEAPLHSAVEKIAHTLPESVLVDMESLRGHYTFAAPASATTDETTLLQMQRAIDTRRRVRIHYHTASRNAHEWRTVDPHHLHNSGGDWYLIAWDHKRRAIRTFHLGRIEEHQVLEEHFARHKFDAQKWLRETFAAEETTREENVAVRFDAAQAIYIRERVYHPSQQIEEQEDGELILRFHTSGLGAVKRWVMQFGSHAEVLAPESLRREVAEEARKLCGIYEEYSDA
jgi:predicted DNA-binding transcriptional regulator YafY